MSKAIQFRRNGEKIYPCPYYPVGSIYLSVNNTNPGTIFGGTWEQIKDRFLLACGSTYANGSTGGEATHKLTNNELPKLSGYFPTTVPSSHGNYATGVFRGGASTWSGKTLIANESGGTYMWGYDINIGGDASHNNMPPYLAVYVWKRVS